MRYLIDCDIELACFKAINGSKMGVSASEVHAYSNNRRYQKERINYALDRLKEAGVIESSRTARGTEKFIIADGAEVEKSVIARKDDGTFVTELLNYFDRIEKSFALANRLASVHYASKIEELLAALKDLECPVDAKYADLIKATEKDIIELKKNGAGKHINPSSHDYD